MGVAMGGEFVQNLRAKCHLKAGSTIEGNKMIYLDTDTVPSIGM